jgi:hypothetical protein
MSEGRPDIENQVEHKLGEPESEDERLQMERENRENRMKESDRF